MGVNVDTKTLEVAAAASARIYDQAVIHIGEEIKARDPENITAHHLSAREGRFIARIGHGTDPTSR
jgi:hypothetical protein